MCECATTRGANVRGRDGRQPAADSCKQTNIFVDDMYQDTVQKQIDVIPMSRHGAGAVSVQLSLSLHCD